MAAILKVCHHIKNPSPISLHTGNVKINRFKREKDRPAFDVVEKRENFFNFTTQQPHLITATTTTITTIIIIIM